VDIKLRVEIVSMILLLVAFPVISIGADGGIAAVWWIGFVAFVVGGLLPIVTRYMNHSKDAPRDVGMEFDDRPS